MTGTRGPNGRSPILFDEKRGDWHSWVSLGTDQLTGHRRRRHVRAATRAELMRKVQKLEVAREAGDHGVDRADATVEAWLREWLTAVHATRRAQTYAKADWACRLYLIPALGKVKLAKLTTPMVQRAMSGLTRASKTGEQVAATDKTKHAVLIQLVTALNEAVRQRRLSRNPAAFVRLARPETAEVEPLTGVEVAAVIQAVRERRNGARWVLALTLGLRQSELLGLRWADVDLDRQQVTVRSQLARHAWAHGCGDAGRCGTAASCPSRVRRRRDAALKTKAARRVLHLPDALVAMLRRHRREQVKERLLAAEMWVDSDYVFTSAVGTPVDQRNDLRDWTAVLSMAGVSSTRIHDLRHTNATLLLVENVPTRVVQDLMGWSSAAMTSRYQHVVDAMSQAASETVAASVLGDISRAGA